MPIRDSKTIFDEWSNILRESNLEKTCEQCGKAFQIYTKINRFCSMKCMTRWHDIRKIAFLGKVIELSWNPRKFRCSLCDTTAGRFDMHHKFYCPCMPWVCMVELCISCHAKASEHPGRKKGSKNKK